MGGPSRTGSSSARTFSTFGDGSWRLRFSSTCTPGSRCSTMTSSVAVTSMKKASWRSATRSQDGLYAPGSMAPPKASTAAAAVAWPARARGSSPRERLAASGPSRSGRLVSPAITPASLVASHVPPPTSSRPPRIAGPTPSVSRQVIGIAGRSRRSSRLAATTSGSPGTIPLITINRHIATQRTSRARRPLRRAREGTAAAELWLTTRDAAYEAESRGVLGPTPFGSTASTSTGSPPPARWTWPSSGIRTRRTRSLPPPTGWWRSRRPSRGASPTPPPTAGTGGPTAGSSTTSSCSRSPTGSPGKAATSQPRREVWTTCWVATPLGQSYITGYGTDCTRHQRTRHFAHDLDPSLPPPPRATRRRTDVEDLLGLPRRSRLGSPTGPTPLPRRADVGDHQRRVHPLERSPRVHVRLAHAHRLARQCAG